jgi:hypothetical protein
MSQGTGWGERPATIAERQAGDQEDGIAPWRRSGATVRGRRPGCASAAERLGLCYEGGVFPPPAWFFFAPCLCGSITFIIYGLK